MTNTHVLLNEFEYVEPASLEEASSLLKSHGDRAVLLAGGTYLLVQMKQEHKSPAVVINIQKLAGLSGAAWQGNTYSLGALTTIERTRSLASVHPGFQALTEACAAFGSMQIQMMGTLGGNVCNGSPASDTVPALMALNAALVLAGPQGERVIPLASFLLGPGKVSIRPGEILTHIRLPEPDPGSGSAFIKLTRVQADLAKVSVAAWVRHEADQVVECRIAFGSVAPTVIRAPASEAYLMGKHLTPKVALRAGEIAMGEVSPIDDVRSNAWYRRQVVRAMTHDVLIAAWQRAAAPSTESAAARQPESQLSCQPPANSLRVGPADRHPVTLTVNGELRRLWVAPNDLLLNVVREKLELTGAKYGCGIGECGACTVLLNGVPTLGCLALAIAADGSRVQTVEGLQAADGTLHPLQEAFLDQQAFQCGYCTPGVLIMSKALLEQNPAPTEDHVREYLRGNRCRCTGFASIVRAVLSVADPERTGEWSHPTTQE
jgi:xanthine dehydrogenase iron-sulfur cluster and FAD-binding subunit A